MRHACMQALHPWLLEVNSSPSIMAQHDDPHLCDMIREQKYAMLADTFSLIAGRIQPVHCKLQPGRDDGDGSGAGRSSASRSVGSHGGSGVSGNGGSMGGGMSSSKAYELAHLGEYIPLPL